MKIHGLISAPFSPMHEDGSLNLARIPEYADFLKRNGSAGVFVCGTTGESMSLSLDERISLSEEWIKHKTDNFKVIIHVGHNCLKDAQLLAKHAEKIDADAIGALAPFFFKPSLDNLIDFCAELSGVAPNLPFYYYHIPCMTGVNINIFDLLKKGAKRIPNLSGAKYTHEDLMDYNLCLQLDGGKYDMLFGRDEILLSGLALGAQGGVGSSYNFAMPLYSQIIEEFKAGNLAAAQECQLKSAQLIQLFHKYGGVVAAKAIMKLAGFDCGPCRLPLPKFTDEQYTCLQKDLELIKFFEYCSK